MKKLLITHHTMTGGTLQMAQAAAVGAATQTPLRSRESRCLEIAPDANPEQVAQNTVGNIRPEFEQFLVCGVS